MYRLSEELAKLIMSKIKAPEIESSGPNVFLPKNLNSVGIIDSMVACGVDYHFVLECPNNVLYPELPVLGTDVQGYFLYRKEELQKVEEPWEVQRVFVDPTCVNAEERIDVREAAIQLPNGIEKLTCKTISTLEKLIEKEPLILDCIDLGRK
jgi:hypothetical protein